MERDFVFIILVLITNVSPCGYFTYGVKGYWLVIVTNCNRVWSMKTKQLMPFKLLRKQKSRKGSDL